MRGGGGYGSVSHAENRVFDINRDRTFPLAESAFY